MWFTEHVNTAKEYKHQILVFTTLYSSPHYTEIQWMVD